MLVNLKNIKFIGDLSLEDADILAGYAKNCEKILEFGSGGSTQIFAQSNARSIISVETDQKWIDLTASRLAQFGTTVVEFSSYATHFDKFFDLIFVDGVDSLRKDFAIKTWKLLKLNGIMLFHDTRRFRDFQNVAWISQLYFNEIKQIDVNATASNGISSNITVLHKKQYEPYVNWNKSENKPEWSYGKSDDAEHLLWEYKK